MSGRNGSRTLRISLAVGIAAAILLLAPPSRAGDDGADAPSSVALARVFAPSFVHVEVALRYDEGQAPTSLGKGRGDYSGLVAEERPLEEAGIVLAPDRVLVVDPQIHPRFVSSVTVVFGGQRVGAKPIAWAADEDGAILALDSPLSGVKPLAFDASAKPPYRAVYHGKAEGAWTTVVGAAMQRVDVADDGRVTSDSWSPAILVDKAGTPVGATVGEAVAVEGPWKGSPLSWPLVTAEEHERLLQRTEAQANAALLRVHLRLRSPKAEGGSGNPYRFFSRHDDDEQGSATERDPMGVLVDAKRILVLDSLDAKTTGRLEAIEVHLAGGETVPAKFVSSYRHYGAFLAETERPIEGVLTLSTTPLPSLRERLLLVARVDIQGERRVLYCSHVRVSSFEEGWRRQRVPDFGDSVAHHVLFDRDGALLAVPIERRLPDRERRWRRDEAILLPAEYLAPLLADPVANADPTIVPVAAEREDRIAWLGVESQRLDRDLARVNGVSHLTRDGQSGALVSYVYPGSPAEKAGIQPGVVLLRIHSPDRPKPIEVAASEDPYSAYRGFLDSQDDEGESRFGDAMPGFFPWPSAENEVNRALTEIGFGRPFTLEYAANGEVKKAEMKVEEGPVHFEAAPLFKSEALGVTVKDLTYEVRRYYQVEANAPGVIVSKTESGERAAVAGLRRLDMVLRVNDKPVASAAEFSKAVADGGEIRLAVKDRLKERVVKIAAPKADAAPKDETPPMEGPAPGK